MQAALGNKAIAIYGLGETDRAYRLLKDVERICREVGYNEGFAISLIDQAIINAFDYKRTDDALSMAREAHGIVESCQNKALIGQMYSIRKSLEDKATERTLMETVGAEEGKIPTHLIMWPAKMPKLEKK